MADSESKGRCRPCGLAYRWQLAGGAHRRLQFARCTHCGRALDQTSWQLTSAVWRGEPSWDLGAFGRHMDHLALRRQLRAG